MTSTDPSTTRSTRVGLLLATVVAIACLAMPADGHAQSDPPWETGQSRAEDLQIKLVIFSPGNQIANWFGHAAVVVEDTRLRESRLYNYGMFSFDGALLVKFAMGRLWFWVGEQPEYATYRYYEQHNRDVRIHLLDLSPDERMDTARFLSWNAEPENRRYLYHHYHENCSTRPRDIVNAAVDGALREAAAERSELTLREHTRRYTHHSFFMDLFLMFMMNDDIDQPIEQWHAMFLPDELEETVRDLDYETASGETRELVEDTTVFHDADRRRIPEKAPAHWPWALLMGVILGLGAFAWAAWWRRRHEDGTRRVAFGLYNTMVGSLVGIPGLLLFVMSLITNHRVTYWNENLFFANPLTFAILPLGIALAWGKSRAVEWMKWIWTALVATGLLGLALKVLPAFDQQNRLPVALIYPISVGFAAAYWWLAQETEANGPGSAES